MSHVLAEHESGAGEAPNDAAMLQQSINPSPRLSAVSSVADHVGSMPATMMGLAVAGDVMPMPTAMSVDEAVRAAQ